MFARSAYVIQHSIHTAVPTCSTDMRLDSSGAILCFERVIVCCILFSVFPPPVGLVPALPLHWLHRNRLDESAILLLRASVGHRVHNPEEREENKGKGARFTFPRTTGKRGEEDAPASVAMSGEGKSYPAAPVRLAPRAVRRARKRRRRVERGGADGGTLVVADEIAKPLTLTSPNRMYSIRRKHVTCSTFSYHTMQANEYAHTSCRDPRDAIDRSIQIHANECSPLSHTLSPLSFVFRVCKFVNQDPFFPEAGGTVGGEAADPMAAAPAGYADSGSPPPVVYAGMPEPAAYDLGGAAGGGEPFGVGGDSEPLGGGGDGEQLGGGGAEDQFSGMPLQVGGRGPRESERERARTKVF